jgi:transcriptional regulator with XRE-family HTH domain
MLAKIIDQEDIRAAREQRGWSQQELAERVGISRQTVINWELGKVEASRASMALVSLVFQEE